MPYGIRGETFRSILSEKKIRQNVKYFLIVEKNSQLVCREDYQLAFNHLETDEQAFDQGKNLDQQALKTNDTRINVK